jgi:CheY-like chemotaxis protein
MAAAEGAEAVELYRSSFRTPDPFTIVMLDLTVPGGMGGLEASRAIRKIDPAAKLIISSGYSTDPVMANHEQYGIDAVVPKPYTIAELTRVLRSVNGQKKQTPPDGVVPSEPGGAQSTPITPSS